MQTTGFTGSMTSKPEININEKQLIRHDATAIHWISKQRKASLGSSVTAVREFWHTRQSQLPLLFTVLLA